MDTNPVLVGSKFRINIEPKATKVCLAIPFMDNQPKFKTVNEGKVIDVIGDVGVIQRGEEIVVFNRKYLHKNIKFNLAELKARIDYNFY